MPIDETADADDQPTIPLAWVGLRASVMRGELSDWPRAHHLAMQSGEIEEAWRAPWWAHVAEIEAVLPWWLNMSPRTQD